MPYKNRYTLTLSFTPAEGTRIEEAAIKQNVTPYALGKRVIMKELNMTMTTELNKMINEISNDCYKVVAGWVKEDWGKRKKNAVEDYLQYGIKEEYKDFITSLEDAAEAGYREDYDKLIQELNEAAKAANNESNVLGTLGKIRKSNR